jgi:hypothetical protein
MPGGDGWKRPGQDAEALTELAGQLQELTAELKAARAEAGSQKIWTAEGRRLFWVTAWATLAGGIAVVMAIGYAVLILKYGSHTIIARGDSGKPERQSGIYSWQELLLAFPIFMALLWVSLGFFMWLFKIPSAPYSWGYEVPRRLLSLALAALTSFAALALIAVLGYLSGIW